MTNDKRIIDGGTKIGALLKTFPFATYVKHGAKQTICIAVRIIVMT